MTARKTNKRKAVAAKRTAAVKKPVAVEDEVAPVAGTEQAVETEVNAAAPSSPEGGSPLLQLMEILVNDPLKAQALTINAAIENGEAQKSIARSLTLIQYQYSKGSVPMDSYNQVLNQCTALQQQVQQLAMSLQNVSKELEQYKAAYATAYQQLQFSQMQKGNPITYGKPIQT